MAIRRAGSAIAIGALAFGLVTACGGSDSKSSSDGSKGSVLNQTPVAVVTAAADRTAAAKNAHFEITGNVSARGQSLPVTGHGTADFAGHNQLLTVTVPPLGDIEVRQIGTVVYAKLPQGQAAQFGGKPWLKVDLSSFGGANGNPLGSLNQSNPAQLLETLRGASTNVTKVGDEDVRGAHTAHYRADVDLKKLSQQSGQSAAVQQQIQQAFGANGTLPVEVWVDDAGLARRVKVTLPGASSGGSSEAPSGSVQVEFFDFGAADEAVDPPPADQVTDFSQVLGQLGQLGGTHA